MNEMFKMTTVFEAGFYSSKRPINFNETSVSRSTYLELCIHWDIYAPFNPTLAATLARERNTLTIIFCVGHVICERPKPVTSGRHFWRDVITCSRLHINLYLSISSRPISMTSTLLASVKNRVSRVNHAIL